MIWEKLKNRKNFVEEDFIELRDSVKELTSIIEKYKDMRKDSDGYIRELKNLNSLGESYFDSRIDNSIYSYYVYDKNNLEKTHQANNEIEVAKERFGKILSKITEKVVYHKI